MLFPRNFFRIILKADFNPEKGNKNQKLHTIQCKVPLRGSYFVLFLLSFLGIFFLCVHMGFLEKKKMLEISPFSSSIRIQGQFTIKQLHKLQNTLVFNSHSNTLEFVQKDNQQKYHLAVIQGVYPCKTVYIRFVDTKGNFTQETYEVITFTNLNGSDLPNNDEHQQNSNIQLSEPKACKDISSWIKNQLSDEQSFFRGGNDNGMIISKSLFQKLGLSQSSDKHLQDDTISFIYPFGKKYLIEERTEKRMKNKWKKSLSKQERIDHEIRVPLRGISTFLPGGDAIITEVFYEQLREGLIDPCKVASQVYLKWSGKNDKLIHQKIREWAEKSFKPYLVSCFQMPYRQEIKLQFTPPPYDHKKYDQLLACCNIKRKLLDLNNELKPIEIQADFPDNNAYKYESDGLKHKTYTDIYLYINKTPVVINQIHQLTYILDHQYDAIIDTHQVMTLKKYREDINIIFYIFYALIIIIGIIIFSYIYITFILLIQSKINNIGVLMAMGASKRSITLVYLYEALKLIFIPLCLSLLLGYSVELLWKTMFEEYFYNFNIFYVTWISFVTILIALLGAFKAINNVVSQKPYKLISYKF